MRRAGKARSGQLFRLHWRLLLGFLLVSQYSGRAHGQASPLPAIVQEGSSSKEGSLGRELLQAAAVTPPCLDSLQASLVASAGTLLMILRSGLQQRYVWVWERVPPTASTAARWRAQPIGCLVATVTVRGCTSHCSRTLHRPLSSHHSHTRPPHPHPHHSTTEDPVAQIQGLIPTVTNAMNVAISLAQACSAEATPTTAAMTGVRPFWLPWSLGHVGIRI